MSSLLASLGETSELDQARRSSKDQEAATGDEDGGVISAEDPAILLNIAGPSKQRTGSSRTPLGKRNTNKAGRPSPGIIYISRLPPGMTPQKVKHLMSSYGDIGRVYAQRSDALAESASKPQYKKHQSANFTEAWLEFMDKRIAKTVAPMLNAQLIGGKKGDKWRDDIWTMRYLSGFRWEMLGEQVAYERQAHQARLRQSLSQSKTEQTEYLKNVELARVLEKRRAKQSAQPDVNVDGGDKKRTKTTDDRVIHKTSSVPIKGEVGSDKARRTYKQREFAEDRASTGGSAGKSSGNTSNALQGVLNDLF